MSGSIKEAAKVIIDVASAKRCTYEKLETLAKIKESRFNPRGSKNIEVLFKPYLDQLAQICQADINQAIEEGVDSEFSDQVNKGGHYGVDGHVGPIFSGRSLTNFFSEKALHDIVWAMAQADPSANLAKETDDETGEYLPKVHHANMARAFEQYLAEPCKEYLSKYGHFFERAAITAHFVGVQQFVDSMTYEVKQKVLTYDVCRAITEDSNLKKKTINY